MMTTCLAGGGEDLDGGKVERDCLFDLLVGLGDSLWWKVLTSLIDSGSWCGYRDGLARDERRWEGRKRSINQ